MSKSKTTKIALVRKTQISDWVSCQSITQNLCRSYTQAFGSEVDSFQLSQTADLYECYELVEHLASLEVKVITWVDHYPHPSTFIKAFRAHQKNCENTTWRPILNFHIFGDFSLQSPLWLDCQEELRGMPIIFTCASHAQQSFVRQFLKEDHTHLVPFPCDENVFHFSEIERANTRERWGIEDRTPVFLYTGRVSRQKNVLELILAFKQASSHLSPKPQLFIAGDFDDLNIPFLGLHSDPGHYFQSLVEQQDSENIHLLGQLTHDELRRAYNASDLYISLSTHNDEDYGMCPAEAALCGLPMTLSGWGGYHSFSNYLKKDCTLIEVKVQNKRILPNTLDVQKRLMAFEQQHETSRRDELSRKAQSIFGIQAVADKLESFYSSLIKVPAFEGFQENFEKFSASFILSPRAPFRNAEGSYNTDYIDAYKHYFTIGTSDE